MLLASGLTVAFLVAGISAYAGCAGSAARMSRRRCAPQCGSPPLLIPLQIAAGDQARPQYAGAPAGEDRGEWKAVQSVRGAPMVVFGLPDEALHANRYEIAIPHLASVYLTHSLDGEIKGPRRLRDHPPVAPVFFAFSRHGRHGHADALRIVARGVEAAPGKTADRGLWRAGWSP